MDNNQSINKPIIPRKRKHKGKPLSLKEKQEIIEKLKKVLNINH